MKKRIIALLICLIICFSLFATVAYAYTDVDKIMPSGGFWIILENQETPIHRAIQIMPNGKTLIIIPAYMEPTAEDEAIEYIPTYEEDEEPAPTPTPTPSAEPTPEIENELAKQIFNLTNAARKDNDMPVLKYNTDLQKAADLRAKEAAEKFSHTRPNGMDFATTITVDYNLSGENIVKAESTNVAAEVLVEAWMKSQGHRENILLYEYTSTAIGIYIDSTTTYAVQLFLG